MIKKLENREMIYGTSFHGVEVKASKNDLERAIGFPSNGPTEDGKVTNEWDLETDYGVFSVYDWKEYDGFGDDEEIYWHIGGKDSISENKLGKKLMDRIKKLPKEENSLLGLFEKTRYLSVQDIAKKLGMSEGDDKQIEGLTREILSLFKSGVLDYEGRWGETDYWKRKP